MSDSGTRRFDDRLYIPVSKLPELLEGPKLSVYYRETKNQAMRELLPPFPKRAIEEFCPIVKSIISRGQGYYVFNGGDPDAHRDVLKWILSACNSSEGTKLHFRTVEDNEDPFRYYPEVMKSAERLGIKGFAAGIQKRLMAYSRKNLMDIDIWYEYYDIDEKLEEKLKLREVVVESIFQTWYDSKKEGRWNDEIDADVGEMRHDYPSFGDALDERVEKQKQDREAYLAGKKAEKSGMTNTGGGAGWDNNDNSNNGSNEGPSDWDADASTPASGELDSNASTEVTQGISWADETQNAHENAVKW